LENVISDETANTFDDPDEVVKDFRETGKYSEAFLKELKDGLKKR
jgi:hypothetical protein